MFDQFKILAMEVLQFLFELIHAVWVENQGLHHCNGSTVASACVVVD